VRLIGGTLTSALTPTGSHQIDEKRKALNFFICTSKLFDAVVDFDRATLDPRNGRMRSEFVPDSTMGAPGDYLHPNRLGYRAMGRAIDRRVFLRAEK
jgi:lysophospholipase L1-like esterase